MFRPASFTTWPAAERISWSSEDDSQSIYSFRGADFRNIMDFPKLFPDTRVITLEENYRSVESILALTNQLIDQAAEKVPQNPFFKTAGPARAPTRPYRGVKTASRASWSITSWRYPGRAYHSTTSPFFSGPGFILSTWKLSSPAMASTMSSTGASNSWNSAHIKDVLAYLRILCKSI